MNFDALREAIASDSPGRSRPALASLVDATPEEAEPLLLLGLQQSDMLLRQLSCSGLGCLASGRERADRAGSAARRWSSEAAEAGPS